MLIIFGGLPGTGKSTLAKKLAAHLEATYLRIDSIEHALKGSMLNVDDVMDAGYLVGYALAKDNLSIGKTVVADSVNPLEVTRKAWLNVAHQLKCKAIEIEITCSDTTEHQKRVETRDIDIIEFVPPDWQKVASREYEPYKTPHITIDTAGKSIDDSIKELLKKLQPIIQSGC